MAATPSRRDLVGAFVEAFRAEGLKVGLYYALLDRNCPFYEDDARYAEYLRRCGEVGFRAIASLEDEAVFDAIRNLSVVKEDPTVLKDFDSFWAALAGPE